MKRKKALISYASDKKDDVMPVPRHWHPVFFVQFLQKKRFRVYQLSWIPVSSTGMTPKRLLGMTRKGAGMTGV